METVVVTVHGALDAANGVALDDVLADLIDGQGNPTVVVDLHDVAAVDLSSVAVLVAAAAAAAGRGGTLTFADPMGSVVDALDEAGLGRAVIVTRRRHLRSVSGPAGDPDRAERRRTAMTQHPAKLEPLATTRPMERRPR